MQMIINCVSFNLYFTLPPQLAAARPPDRPPHDSGDPRLHADVVRHVLQRVDLPRRHRGLGARVFHLVPAARSDVTVWTDSPRTETKMEEEVLWIPDTKWKKTRD